MEKETRFKHGDVVIFNGLKVSIEMIVDKYAKYSADESTPLVIVYQADGVMASIPESLLKLKGKC
jgi:hypothetical protein